MLFVFTPQLTTTLFSLTKQKASSSTRNIMSPFSSLLPTISIHALPRSRPLARKHTKEPNQSLQMHKVDYHLDMTNRSQTGPDSEPDNQNP